MAAPAYEREVELFRQHGGGLRMAEALRLGINRKTLYAMRDAGVVEAVSRGVYRLTSLEPLAHPDLVTVAKRVPQGVLCLISALSFHELTIAWRIQELAEGGLSASALARITELGDQMPERWRMRLAPTDATPAPALEPRDPRIPPVGTVLRRV